MKAFRSVGCILLCLGLLLGLCGCKQDEPEMTICARELVTSFWGLMGECDGQWTSVDEGRTASVQSWADRLEAELLAYEDIDKYTDAKAFLQVVIQFDDVYAAEKTELFDYPDHWLHAIWKAMDILSFASYSETEEDFLEIIDRHAWNWLDAEYREGDPYRIVVPEEVAWDADRSPVEE